MDKLRRLDLIERSLGIRHKLRVFESGKAPDTHEDLAHMLLSKWELEDELHAIEEILSETRQANVKSKKIAYEKNGYHILRKGELAKGDYVQGMNQRLKTKSFSDQN